MKEKQELIKAWREELDNIYDKKVPATEIGRRIYKIVCASNYPKEEFMKLIDSISMDIPNRFKHLLCRSFLITAAVWRVFRVICLWGFSAAKTNIWLMTWLRLLAMLLQITNILRDVKEDAMSNRLYIPKEFLQKPILTPMIRAASWLTKPVYRSGRTGKISWKRFPKSWFSYSKTG